MADWRTIKEDYFGLVSSIEEANSLIKDYEYDICTSYSEVKTSKDFKKFNISECTKYLTAINCVIEI